MKTKIYSIQSVWTGSYEKELCQAHKAPYKADQFLLAECDLLEPKGMCEDCELEIVETNYIKRICGTLD
jgi:hypothetical protein